MDFRNITDTDEAWTLVASGTSFHGLVLNTTYDRLVSVLGEPIDCMANGSGDGKVQVEWYLLFEDGTPITIYDWKTYHSPETNTHWHVGGRGGEAPYVHQLFPDLVA